MMHAKKKKKLMYGKGGMAKLAQYMKGGRIYAENGDQVPDRSERITAYADDLSNNYGTTRGFGKALQDYMKVLNYLGQKSDHSAFSDEFSSRARNLFDDHFYRTDESASRDVTPESERDESLVDRARVNQFYRDLFQSALSEGGEAADRIFFMQENADKRRLLDEVDKDLSDFKNSPEGKQAAQMAGPMMSLVNQYSKGGTVKYRSGDMMKYPGGGLFPVRKVTSRQTLRPGMQYEYANPDNRQELIDQGFKFRTTPQGKTVVITPDGDRAVYRDRGELGTELKFKQSMALGGLVKKYQNGGVEGDPNKIDTAIDPTKNVSPRYTDEQVLTLSDFPENEGMQQATSEGKIDAFNFSLPESGSLDDLDDQTKQDILATDFGQEHLSGEGSLDDQYNAYAATVINTINNNPEEALQAINAAIESGNESFQGLEGMSDAEKLRTAKSYMTDKKIGNFHTAFKFDTVSTPKIQMFDPRKIPNMIDRGQNLEPVVVAVGDRAIPNGKAMEFRDAAIEAGIDPSKSSPEFIKFFNTWVEENGFDDARQGIRRNNDNYAFINQGYNLFRDQTRR